MKVSLAFRVRLSAPTFLIVFSDFGALVQRLLASVGSVLRV